MLCHAKQRRGALCLEVLCTGGGRHRSSASLHRGAGFVGVHAPPVAAAGDMVDFGAAEAVGGWLIGRFGRELGSGRKGRK